MTNVIFVFLCRYFLISAKKNLKELVVKGFRYCCYKEVFISGFSTLVFSGYSVYSLAVNMHLFYCVCYKYLNNSLPSYCLNVDFYRIHSFLILRPKKIAVFGAPQLKKVRSVGRQQLFFFLFLSEKCCWLTHFGNFGVSVTFL